MNTFTVDFTASDKALENLIYFCRSMGEDLSSEESQKEFAKLADELERQAKLVYECLAEQGVRL